MSDHPLYGDRRVTRRIGEERRDKPERRESYPGRGRAARKGNCAECGDETECVVIWDGKPVSLCPPCGEKIRMGGPY